MKIWWMFLDIKLNSWNSVFVLFIERNFGWKSLYVLIKFSVTNQIVISLLFNQTLVNMLNGRYFLPLFSFQTDLRRVLDKSIWNCENNPTWILDQRNAFKIREKFILLTQRYVVYHSSSFERCYRDFPNVSFFLI